jgi:hypothetical protein
MEAVIQQAVIKELTAAGCIDLDAVKLADLSAVGLDHGGKPVGVKKAVADLKAAHPLMFEPKFDARTATPAEFNANAQKLGLSVRKYR